MELKGTAKVESKFVRSIKYKSLPFLEIFADPPAIDSTHGNIREVPYISEDKEAAEYLAGELARQSELL